MNSGKIINKNSIEMNEIDLNLSQSSLERFMVVERYFLMKFLEQNGNSNQESLSSFEYEDSQDEQSRLLNFSHKLDFPSE